MRRALLGLAVLMVPLAGLVVLAPPASAAPVNTLPPSVAGTPRVDEKVTADPGQWTSAAAYSYQWLRDGQPIQGATAPTYEPAPDDQGHLLAVRVTADDGAGGSATADSAPVGPVQKGVLKAKGGQKIVGVARFTRALDARPGRYSATPAKVTFQWRRSGKDVPGATGRRYEIRSEDVGRRLKVRMTVLSPGYEPLVVTTRPTPRVRHRIDVRRVVRYHVETRGRITTSLKKFRAQAQQTFADPRGWRGAGIEFRAVRRGGAFTLVLSAAGLVPSFSSACSSMWSCRVGRYVIINQERWKHASPAWNAADLELRDYRHMVVNHETGHWLGLGHASCPGPGRLAPVMMQQSKGLGGCRFNPFPTLRELNRRTPHGRAMADLPQRGYPPVQVE